MVVLMARRAVGDGMVGTGRDDALRRAFQQ
jgi:hypothetical protein